MQTGMQLATHFNSDLSSDQLAKFDYLTTPQLAITVERRCPASLADLLQGGGATKPADHWVKYHQGRSIPELAVLMF